MAGEINLSERVAINKTSELAAKVRPLKIELSAVAHLDEYFRCIFIKARRTQNLLNAHSIARVAFGTENGEKYMPHLSLIYGDLNRQTKENIIKNIGCNIDILFVAKELFLYHTAGQPKDWYCVSKRPLAGNS